MQLESRSPKRVTRTRACARVHVFSFAKEVKGEVSFPGNTPMSSVLFRFCSVLNHKVGLTAVMYLAGYPAFLQPRCQERQSPGYLRKIWLCFFPSPAPAQGMLGLEASTYLIHTPEKLGMVAPGCFRERWSRLGAPWTFSSVWQVGQQGRENNGNFDEEVLGLLNKASLWFLSARLLLGDWESSGFFWKVHSLLCNHWGHLRVWFFSFICRIKARSSALTEQSPEASSSGATPAPPPLNFAIGGKKPQSPSQPMTLEAATGSSWYQCRGNDSFPCPPPPSWLHLGVCTLIAWCRVSTYYSLIADF